MTNPIDRALEQLCRELPPYSGQRDTIRSILTDLDAEIRANAEAKGYAEGVLAPCECKYSYAAAEDRARLAAVAEFVTAERYPPEREDYICDTILALARGEGGEQDGNGLVADHVGSIPRPAAPDAALDEIVREYADEIHHRFGPIHPIQENEPEQLIRAACIRARETVLEEVFGKPDVMHVDKGLLAGLCSDRTKLAAVREAKDRLRGSILAEELDAILDGKGAAMKMKPDGWCCMRCGKFDLREHPEQLAKPQHVSHRGVDIGECPGKFRPFVWSDLDAISDGKEAEDQ